MFNGRDSFPAIVVLAPGSLMAGRRRLRFGVVRIQPPAACRSSKADTTVISIHRNLPVALAGLLPPADEIPDPAAQMRPRFD